MDSNEISQLNSRLKNYNAQKIVDEVAMLFKNKIALASSMGAEDQVLTDMIAKSDKRVPVFTLDTGRLFPETYDLIDRTSKKYKIQIQIYFPNPADIEKMVNEKGINLFYDNVENRKFCCKLRKTDPLKRAFNGLDAWICGLRSEQSVTRQNIDIVEWDENNKLIKINPLAKWSNKELFEYIKKNRVPYNVLHDKGYPSIGCQPCTRAITEGEDIRAGRWWWENPETKECGLHKKG
ncbi:phosphoadenylyl-sulfate reductase [Marinilabiliaceae bacterium ANBcel2]|nr:phosphoadenylyl-sulfate reductase [Marinilabiliaceae bacterium ANBcel2]